MHYKFRLFIRNYYIVNGIVNLIKKSITDMMAPLF